MKAERSPLAQIGQNLLDSFVPGRRDRRIKAEQIAEEARKSLDSAYSALGGESGKDVTMEQIKAVLTAELNVLDNPLFRKQSPLFINGHLFYSNKESVRKALGLSDYDELYAAEDFMLEKHDWWTQTRNAFVSNPVSESEEHEVRRRIIACDSAAVFLSEFRESKFGYRSGTSY